VTLMEYRRGRIAEAYRRSKVGLEFHAEFVYLPNAAAFGELGKASGCSTQNRTRSPPLIFRPSSGAQRQPASDHLQPEREGSLYTENFSS
jgi:hypothetical protein